MNHNQTSAETRPKLRPEVHKSREIAPGIRGDRVFESAALALADTVRQDAFLINWPMRWLTARDNFIEQIPGVIVEFPDMMAALQRAISLQMERRPSKDGTLYRLCEQFDTLKQRGRPRKGEEGKKLLTGVSINRGRSASARQTAELIGCNYGKVDKIRKIRRHGKPEIQDAVRNDKMTINKAYSTIRKMVLGTDEEKRNLRSFMKGAKLVFSDQTLERLKELGGDLQAHVNAAIEQHIRQIHDKKRTHCNERAPSRTAERHEDYGPPQETAKSSRCHG